jgi:hypothetical protein
VSQARWGLTEVAVNGADIAGVAIRMQPGMTVSGQLLVKGTAPPPDLSQVRISLAPGSSGAVPGYFPSAPVDGQGRFRIEGAIPGRTA